MTKTCVVVALIIAFCAFGQLVLAETPHNYQVRVVPRTQGNAIHASTLADNLYPTWAAFAGSPWTSTSSPTNSDGTDLWPCFGGGNTQNVDCPTIGDPTQNFPDNGVAVGSPSYTWSLSACDATSTSSNYCGQTETWYEDDSNDSSDFLIYSITAQQGSNYIADSGTVVFGPNSFGGLSPAANVIIYGDQNFGTMGETGVNNGNCEANYDYPLSSPGWPGSTYVIAAGKTCVAPVTGTVNFVATTEVATPSYTKQKNGTYTVKFTSKYKLQQKWSITLQ